MCPAAKYSILAKVKQANGYVELDKDVHSYSSKVVSLPAKSAELAVYQVLLEHNNSRSDNNTTFLCCFFTNINK